VYAWVKWVRDMSPSAAISSQLGVRMKPKRRFDVALAVTCALAVFPALGQDAGIEDAFRRGAAAMHDGRTGDAETAFREAVQLGPTLAMAHLDLGLVLGREGKLDDAIASLSEALRLDPGIEGGHLFRGIFLHQSNRQDEARTELQKEIDQHPSNAEALTWLGMVELAAGHPEKAVGPFDRAAELQPDNLNLLEFRGRAHNLVARDSYARMARLDPTSWHVHRVQAQLFADEGKHTQAIAEYEAAIKLQDRNPDLYEGAGDEYRKLNQLEAAKRMYSKELELSPQNAVAMYDLGSTDIELGDNAAGVPLLQAMIKAYPGSPVAEYYLGRGLAADGNDAEAVKWLEKSAHGDPEGEVGKRSYYELGRVYRRLQRPVEAQKAVAEYNRRREAKEQSDAKQVDDWQKLAGPAPNAPAN
jgi:tetratricopeptide (TPR) repeat protein